MSNETMNLIFIIAATAVGSFSLLMEWLYLYESSRGITALSFKTYRHYINMTFLASNLVLTFLWITSEEIRNVQMIFCVLMGLWFLTALVSLIWSLFPRIDWDDRAEMRRAILPCIGKVIVLFFIMWLIY